MTFHVAFRGKLDYANPSAARAAFDSLLAKRKDNALLPEIVSLRGKSIVAKYANFVSFFDDVESVQSGLQEAADAATSGRILFDSESGEKLAMEPIRRVGRAPKKREHVDPFRLKGSLTFAKPKDAEAARTAFVRAIGKVPQAAIVAEGSKLRFALQGEAALGVIEDMRVAVQEMLGIAKKGSVRLKHLVWRTDFEAPLAAIGRGKGPRRYVRLEGSLSFKNRNDADTANELARTLLVAPKRRGLTQLVFEQQGAIAKSDHARLVQELDAFLRSIRARPLGGKVWVDVASAWGNKRVSVACPK